MNKDPKPIEKELIKEEYKLGENYYNKLLELAKEKEMKKYE